MVQTFNDLYLDARRRLRAAGVESSALEARLLLCHAARCSREELLQRMNMYAGDSLRRQLDEVLGRRIAGEPVAYITGSWEFCGLPMVVDKSVLIPRMDTEVLVETVVEKYKGRMNAPRVLDLGCGSGCISCAIGRFLPSSRLTLLDLSPEALSIARRNLALNHLSRRAVCFAADMLAPPPLRLGEFDLIVSNPPYIASAEVETLDASVRDWEPRLALDGGEDGLRFYRSITARWLTVLAGGGWLIMEVGEEQAGSVMELMKAASLQDVHAVVDTAGVERVVCGRKE